MRIQTLTIAAHEIPNIRRAHGAGFSLVEATIVLAVLALLTAALAPSINDFVNDARLMKARSDVQVIAVGMSRFALDVPARSGRSAAWSRLDVLVGPGRIPAPAGGDTERWLAHEQSDRANFLDDYLVTNVAGYERRSHSHGGRMWSKGWAGPYLSTSVGPDPWGQRYAVSVRHGEDGTGWYAVVLSAGPDGIVQTPFVEPVANPASDDLMIVLDPR